MYDGGSREADVSDDKDGKVLAQVDGREWASGRKERKGRYLQVGPRASAGTMKPVLRLSPWKKSRTMTSDSCLSFLGFSLCHPHILLWEDSVSSCEVFKK